MLILKCLLIGCAIMASVMLLLFGPTWYRIWKQDQGEDFGQSWLVLFRWWRMVGRRKVLGTLSGIGFSLLVFFTYWLFSFAV